MPDLSDVEKEISRIIVSSLYPSGVDSESILGVACRVYRGWPTPSGLNSDLISGVVNVTVSPDTDIGRTTTRFALNWNSAAADRQMLTRVVDNVVTIEGTPTIDHSVGLLVDGQTFVYQVRDGDSIGVVAANLAAMVRSTRVVHLTANSFVIPGAVQLIARVVTGGVAYSEVRRQERDIRIIAWCPTPEARDRVASVIDHAFARTSFLTLDNAIRARITYKGTSVYDQAQNSQLFRRDLIYTAEYPTILSDNLPAMLFGDLAQNSARFTA